MNWSSFRSRLNVSSSHTWLERGWSFLSDIPLELIELSHRRPPRKPNNPNPTGTAASTSTSLTTTTSTPVTHSTSDPPITAPVYSMSFTKPVNTIKFLATRAAQLGIPLLMTIALGNALTQIELVDRSSNGENHQEPSNLTVNPAEYWNWFQVPFATHGYYGPFFDSVTPVQPTPQIVSNQGKSWNKKSHKTKSVSTKTQRREWKDSAFKRWFNKFRL